MHIGIAKNAFSEPSTMSGVLTNHPTHALFLCEYIYVRMYSVVRGTNRFAMVVKSVELGVSPATPSDYKHTQETRASRCRVRIRGRITRNINFAVLRSIASKIAALFEIGATQLHSI